MESIINRFSDKIRNLAASDDLLSLGSGGITGYIQSVLVPELATSLIKEDQQVDDDEARRILSESTQIGRLVHEEDEELVTVPNDLRLGEDFECRDEDRPEQKESSV